VEIALSELIAGKATVIKNKDYLSTKEYVTPFMDSMAKITNDFKIQVKLPDQMTGSGEDVDKTYNRVLIEAILPEAHDVDGHQEVIGFLYGLDVRKPVAKIYRGYLNKACLNLAVFTPTWMEVEELKPGEGIKFDAARMLEKTSNFKAKVEKLKKEFLDPIQAKHKLGGWVDTVLRSSYDNGVHNVRVSPNMPIEAYKSLYIDTESQYYVQPGKQASMFDVYNAFTQVITDDERDFINKFEKTMMVNRLLEV
jgi:hypothetical protein